MSNTSKKDEKEVIKDVAAMDAAISSLSYVQLAELLSTKKEQEIDKVTKELTAARGIVASLEAQLANLGIVPAASAAAPTKRGRKPTAFKLSGASPKGATSDKKTKVKRGAVGEAIRAFVAKAGKAGAKVSEIAAATGNKAANVTAFFYAKGNKKDFKKVAPATFALAK
jgi:hypothetical protein